MIIIDLIKELMWQERKTIADISRDTGYPVERISEIIIYGSSPTTVEADEIFKLFGIDIGDVITY